MSELIATAASSINAFTLAKRVAAFNVPVLIQGETGAGKECVAKYIHTVAFGENENAPYIGVNCAAIPENMLECNQVNHLIPTRVLVKGGEITCKILK